MSEYLIVVLLLVISYYFVYYFKIFILTRLTQKCDLNIFYCVNYTRGLCKSVLIIYFGNFLELRFLVVGTCRSHDKEKLLYIPSV